MRPIGLTALETCVLVACHTTWWNVLPLNGRKREALLTRLLPPAKYECHAGICAAPGRDRCSPQQTQAQAPDKGCTSLSQWTSDAALLLLDYWLNSHLVSYVPVLYSPWHLAQGCERPQMLSDGWLTNCAVWAVNPWISRWFLMCRIWNVGAIIHLWI